MNSPTYPSISSEWIWLINHGITPSAQKRQNLIPITKNWSYDRMPYLYCLRSYIGISRVDGKLWLLKKEECFYESQRT